MPCDYKNYPDNWKTKIRPEILERAKDCCEICLIKNHLVVIRGQWHGIKCYQTTDGNIYDESNSELIGSDYLGEVHESNKLIKIVLTIAHLDHDTKNNNPKNLKALCQRCHNRHDIQFRKINRRIKKIKLQSELFKDELLIELLGKNKR